MTAGPLSGTEEVRENLIGELVASERARPRHTDDAVPAARRQYRRPPERPFTAAERDRVTILLGGLTPYHDSLFPAALTACGYRCARLPVPDLAAFQLGRQYGNVGQCNPAYFTVGNLIQFLLQLEAAGLSRQEIIDRYVFFTSGTCGPCRFGMYQAEYQLALRNAGFAGFRVLTFQQNDGVKADSGEPGLRFSVHFATLALNACNVADVLHDLAHRLRPYESREGETDRAIADVVRDMYAHLSEQRPFDVLAHAPRWIVPWLAARPRLRTGIDTPVKIWTQLHGRRYAAALEAARERLDRIDVDRLRIKPVVKVTGEFWAQTTDGPGNYDMFAFLEREGAQVLVEPVGAWVMYLLHQAKARAALERRVLRASGRSPTRSGVAADLRLVRKRVLLSFSEAWWRHEYHRTGRAVGALADPLVPQELLAELAHPFYHSMVRGGEGHLEVGKTIYYTLHRRCHMVLSLKPFGCLPSTQSDGTQSAVTARLPLLNFLSIETSGEGELNAHSRVQMALGEARAAARDEFDAALARTGRRLDDIRDYVEDHPELRRPFYRVPRRPGVAGVAASFVLHVNDLIGRRRRRVFLRGARQ